MGIRKSITSVFFIAAVVCLGLTVFYTTETTAAERSSVANGVIVTFKQNASESQMKETAEDADGTVIDEFSPDSEKMVLLRIEEEKNIQKVTEELEKVPAVKAAQPNYLYTLNESHIVNDPLMGTQWNLDYMDVPEAWALIDQIRPKSQRMEKDKVIVATLDTGIYYEHPDLKENIDVKNCVHVSGEERPFPVYKKPLFSHGTGTAGVIAATSNNGIGMAGVAAGTNNDLISLMGVNVFSNEGYEAQASASTADIIKGLEYACEKGAKVINMCLGHSIGYTDLKGQPHNDKALEAAINDAVYNQDVVITCSAGNTGDTRTWYPSDFEAVISVMNIKKYTNAWSKDCKTKGSSYGSKKDISAPGSSVYTTRMNGSYSECSGTSISAPAVAGVAALVRYVNPDLSVSDVKRILYSTATDLYAPGYDIYTGYGNVNAYGAVAAAAGVKPQTKTEKLVKPSGVKARSAGAHSIEISWNRVSHANGYFIYRATSRNGKYTRIKKTTKAETHVYKDTGRKFNKRYYYKVVAYGTSKDGKKMQSADSSIVSSRARSEVPKPTTSNVDYRTIKISWKRASAANGYRIYRATSKKGSYKLVKTIRKGKVTSWSNTNLKPGKAYHYKIKSYRLYKKKKYYSEMSSILSSRARPSKPSLSVRKKGKKLILKWHSRDYGHINGYKIYRKKESGEWRLVKQKAANSRQYVNRGLKRGEKYSYKIRSYKKVGGKTIYSNYSRIKSKKI